ncbi:hypothetical protein D3C78_1588390 [compost metagenome]
MGFINDGAQLVLADGIADPHVGVDAEQAQDQRGDAIKQPHQRKHHLLQRCQ